MTGRNMGRSPKNRLKRRLKKGTKRPLITPRRQRALAMGF